MEGSVGIFMLAMLRVRVTAYKTSAFVCIYTIYWSWSYIINEELLLGHIGNNGMDIIELKHSALFSLPVP